LSEITSKQRQYLRGLAHALTPVVRIGKSGLTPSVVRESRTALRAHELIKVRIEADDPAERREMAAQLTSDTSAQLVATVGKIAVLYRAREEDPAIQLP
jgi:RNA-binding protein